MNGTISFNHCWILRIPLWMVLIPLAALGSWFAVKWRRQRQSLRRGFPVALAF